MYVEACVEAVRRGVCRGYVSSLYTHVSRLYIEVVAFVEVINCEATAFFLVASYFIK